MRVRRPNASVPAKSRPALRARCRRAGPRENPDENATCATERFVYELASRCRDLYWTKLQKAVFFADMICYERFSCSLTGLSCAHATYGPVMDRKDEVRCILVDRGTIGFRECGWGEILVPLQPGDLPFNAEEMALIDDIARFVNSFNTAPSSPISRTSSSAGTGALTAR